MKNSRKKNTVPKTFREQLEKYLTIKGLDIIIELEDGIQIELKKNRSIENDEIVIYSKNSEERIPISKIKSVDMYAA